LWGCYVCMLWISHFASGTYLAKPFRRFILRTLRQFLPCCSIRAYGNDLHIPSVFGKWRLCFVPEGYCCILELVWSPRVCLCEEIYGWVMCRDVWSSFHFQEERNV
jgi:hypothetical protein